MRRGDGAVDEGGCLQAGIASPQGDEGQQQRLGRPGDRQARTRKQVGGRATTASESDETPRMRARAGCKRRTPIQAPAQTTAAPASARPSLRSTSQSGRTGTRAKSRRRRARTSSRADRDQSCRRRAGTRSPPPAPTSTNEATTAVVPFSGGRIGIESEHGNLSADDDADADQQRVPATRRGKRDRRGEDDHRECHGGPREPGVDRLRAGRAPPPAARSRRPSPTTTRWRSRRQRRQAARERQRQPVRSVVAGRRRRPAWRSPAMPAPAAPSDTCSCP